MTCPAELASFNVAHSDDAIMHLVALLRHPRDTIKDLILAGHVITITYDLLQENIEPGLRINTCSECE